jgi:hypothetical protein
MRPKNGRADQRRRWVLYDFSDGDVREIEDFAEARQPPVRIRKRDRHFVERPRRGCRRKQNLKRRLRRIQKRELEYG